ncbi:hypothetical protein EDC04DRAFT_1907484 [Pisolithus marmoratus]|nr:hypothetical protein EDC04DRAFT_1907484 [Pisolithus marmoratus]
MHMSLSGRRSGTCISSISGSCLEACTGTCIYWVNVIMGLMTHMTRVKNQVSAKYTSAALGTLEYLCGEVAYPVVDGACCHVMLHGMHPVIVRQRWSIRSLAHFRPRATFLTRTFHESPPPIWIMRFLWNGSSMLRRPYNARQLETPRRREPVWMSSYCLYACHSCFTNSCDYMFGVHDHRSRVIRSIMLHTLGEASTTISEQNCSGCYISSLIYSLTSRPVTRDR